MTKEHTQSEASRTNHAPSFEQELMESIRTAPWLAVSILAHALLFLIAAQFPWTVQKTTERPVTIHAELPAEAIDPIEPDVPPPEPDQPIEPEIVETIDLIPADEVTESLDNEEELQDTPSPTNTPFDSNAINDVIGLGGGGGGPGGPHGSRRSGKGSGTATQASVDLGLDWLARHQHPRGHWSSERFSDQCGSNLCDGNGDPAHDVGVTGLALLAFLGSGNAPNQGKYQKVVRSGLKYLMDAQDSETGCFGEVNSHTTFLYDHAIATLAITEGYGLSKWPSLKEPAQKGINFIHASRNPYKAWRYAYPPDGKNDMSITGWMVMALKSADDFGLRVDQAAFDGASLYIDELTDENTWRTGYLSKGGYSSREPGAEDWPESKSEAMTAAAMMCRIFMGQDPDKDPALRGGADLLRKRLPEWDTNAGTIDLYYWYYGSYAMFQMGGKDWNVWQKQMLSAVVDTQRGDGDEKGSWDPQFGPWGARGGRVYSTAIMTLCLEVYYRYDRVLGAR